MGRNLNTERRDLDSSSILEVKFTEFNHRMNLDQEKR